MYTFEIALPVILQCNPQKLTQINFCMISVVEVGFYLFTYMLWNLNAQPISSRHSKNTHLEFFNCTPFNCIPFNWIPFNCTPKCVSLLSDIASEYFLHVCPISDVTFIVQIGWSNCSSCKFYLALQTWYTRGNQRPHFEICRKPSISHNEHNNENFQGSWRNSKKWRPATKLNS